MALRHFVLSSSSSSLLSKRLRSTNQLCELAVWNYIYEAVRLFQISLSENFVELKRLSSDINIFDNRPREIFWNTSQTFFQLCKKKFIVIIREISEAKVINKIVGQNRS